MYFWVNRAITMMGSVTTRAASKPRTASPTMWEGESVSRTASQGSGSEYRSRMGSGLYGHVVDVLGQEIINGTLPVGSLIFADQLCERLGVSRSVVREGVRTLSSMGLVDARRQVGTQVLPPSSWDLLNPQVVRWRSQGPDYVSQMQQLLELRLGIEQVAARLSCERMSAEEAELTLAAALAMRTAMDRSDSRGFFEADADFHRLLLEGTGNAAFAQLANTIGAALYVRADDGRPGMHNVTAESVTRHVGVARALVDRDSARAQAAVVLLVEATIQEFQQLVADLNPSDPPDRLSPASPSPT